MKTDLPSANTTFSSARSKGSNSDSTIAKRQTVSSRLSQNQNSGPVLRLAYLTTTYPSVSHTFIRRELREIERRGHKVLRIAIRRSEAALVDPLDQEEAIRTIHCLSQPIWMHILAIIRSALTRPFRFLSAIKATLAMAFRSDRGYFKHFIYLMEACTLLWILHKHSIQHVHVHFGTNSAAVARLIRRCGGPSYSFTVHGPTEFDAAIGFDLEGKITEAAFVIAITDYCAAQLRRWCQPSQWPKIHVVHCTVGDDFFNAFVPLAPDSHTFVCVGRLTPQKGQLVLIEAFSELLKKGYETDLVFVGDGELRPIIEKMIAALEIDAHVSITGYVSEAEVRKHLVESRALALPSFAEGLPMVIMEAFALGRPVISTYIAGIPELVRHRDNGWLVPAANVADLVSILTEALETPAVRLEEMAASGRRLTYQNHRTISEGARLEAIFMRYIQTSEHESISASPERNNTTT